MVVVAGVSRVEIEYISETSGEVGSVKLDTTPEMEHRKTGTAWILAMQQVNS